MQPLINILIRTSNRPALFQRCLKSVTSQSYENIRIIVCCDQKCDYVPEELERIDIIPDKQHPFFYDLYCNELKKQVIDGWFMFLDDDDVLNRDVLSKIELTSDAIIVQLERAGNVVPVDLNFQRGLIGMPCLILHHSLKDLAHISGSGQGDYFWIKEIISKTQVDFQKVIVVKSFGRGLGKPL